MRAIDPALVDLVWRDMIDYPPERVQSEAQAFLAAQPHVAAFAQAMTKDQEPAVQQAAFGLCFLLFKVLERSVGRPFPLLREERILQAYEATTAWLQDSSPAAVISASSDPHHPTLVAHILSVFYGEPEGRAEYDEGVRASLLLLLKTVTDAVDLGAVEA